MCLNLCLGGISALQSRMLDIRMFIKTVLALLVTMALAAAAVFFGAQQNIDLNETKLHPNTHQSGGKFPNTSPKFLDRFTKNKQVETQLPQRSQPNAAQKQALVDYEKIQETLQQDLRDTFSILLEQAENIDMPNLKDQAYVDIIDYALRSGMFLDAKGILEKINHTELRDTSRGQMAIALARAGQAAEAFELIDQVETDGLRDVLRLQVIEAITLPQNFEPQIVQRLPRE